MEVTVTEIKLFILNIPNFHFILLLYLIFFSLDINTRSLYRVPSITNVNPQKKKCHFYKKKVISKNVDIILTFFVTLYYTCNSVSN